MFRTTHLLATIIVTATVIPMAVAAPPGGKGGHGSGHSGSVNKSQHQTKSGHNTGTHNQGNIIPVVTQSRWQVVTPASPVIVDRSGVFGVMLTQTPEGAAAVARLKTNDVIMSFGGLRTESPEDLDAATSKFAGQKVIAVVLDGSTGEEKPVFVTPAADGTIGATVQQVKVK
jgi:hypothetical protein